MAATTKAKIDTAAPSETDIAESFETTTVTHKGKTYSFRELSAEEYDKCVDLATTGEGDDKDLNTVQLLRWMIVTGSVEPKLDPASLGKLPFSAVGRISRAVNNLHFMQDEDEADKPDEPELDDEGNEKRPNS